MYRWKNINDPRLEIIDRKYRVNDKTGTRKAYLTDGWYFTHGGNYVFMWTGGPGGKLNRGIAVTSYMAWQDAMTRVNHEPFADWIESVDGKAWMESQDGGSWCQQVVEFYTTSAFPCTITKPCTTARCLCAAIQNNYLDIENRAKRMNPSTGS